MIKTWMIEGEINDPFREFFVDTDPNVPDEKLWTSKYSLNYIMIPSFLSNELAQKILQTGKSVSHNQFGNHPWFSIKNSQ